MTPADIIQTIVLGLGVVTALYVLFALLWD